MWVAPHLWRRKVLQEDLSITSAPPCEDDGKRLVTGAYEWCHNLWGSHFILRNYDVKTWCFLLLKLKCIKKWSNNLVPNLYRYMHMTCIHTCIYICKNIYILYILHEKPVSPFISPSSLLSLGSTDLSEKSGQFNQVWSDRVGSNAFLEFILSVATTVAFS